jgi:7,8-dihydropterin-6-yl-methyl-4-(beta-D-ribofuranosyl)aminobenzene 5'-phosphate synthase
MDHFMNPRNIGQIDDADGIGVIGSPECGDQLRVWIKVKDGRLARVRHEVFGCPAAIASCSMMTQLATGLTLEQALKLRDDDVAIALDGLPEAKYHCSNLAASALHNAIENYQAASTSTAHTVKITTLVNNTMPRPLRSEHGLSFWIEYAGRNILFDTGQTDAIVHNAELLDIDLSQTDMIVLSHGHYDHTGGLKAVLESAPNANVFLHPDAPKLRYSHPPGKPPKDVSMPAGACDTIAELFPKGRVFYTAQPTRIAANIQVTGAIPRMTDYEDTGGPFYLDEHRCQADLLTDDQALLLETAKGLVVVLGCAHAGLINTLEYAGQLTGLPIYAVIGGMHLRAASENRIEKTMEALQKYHPEIVAPCHCTGDWAVKLLKDNHSSYRFLDITNHARITV